MPLESCPTCGYALSIVDHHWPSLCYRIASNSSRLFDAKHLQQMIMAVVVLSVVVYFIFFR